ncbi:MULTISPECIES: hypothetical protein [Gammaproteobacteria]|uniref:Uncharacterized protein n=14 Tax=Gammaproteobacteria TaxID=1236 RepID=F1CNL2_ECOLX|nr:MULTISPECIES: hypothetical protein [Gammaproteobacteria]AAN87634.1 putative protein [Citrobacter freundii]AFQ93472.1 hypothetical protein [Enterobacter cloacae]MCN0074468.1 hypothetical protein [Salmonella enterica]ACJ65269.1 hypothetical protein [Klebsiella pneumoniae]ADY00068.1 hypothetical protein [Escherichia coli]
MEQAENPAISRGQFGDVLMLYMALCCFMMIMAFSEMIRTMTALGNGSYTGNRFLPLVFVLLTLALASPFLVTFYALSRPLSMDALSRLSVGAQWAGIAAAILLCILYGYRAWKNGRFWYTGAAIASVVIAVIFANSLLFVSRPDAGIVATFVLNNDDSNDVQCDRSVLLVHYNKGTPTEWRCPTGIMFMSDTSKPFLPWPDYHGGRSQHLTAALDLLTDSALRIDPDQKP